MTTMTTMNNDNNQSNNTIVCKMIYLFLII